MALVVFVLLVACAALFGARFEPGDWYASLAKPPLTPPNWVFAPVWSVLYLFIAVAGWLVWKKDGARCALLLWAAQLILNALWSFIFFGLERPGTALAEISLLLVAVLATAFAFVRVHRPAAALLLPYAVWVAFAGYLNAGIWYLN